MTQSKVGTGARFLIHDGSGSLTALESFLELAEVTEGLESDIKVDKHEVTNHQSGGYKEFITGSFDGGVMPITCNRIGDASQGILEANFKAGTRVTTLLIPVGATQAIQQDVIVEGSGKTYPVNGVEKLTFSCQKTGAESLVAIPS